MTNSSIGVKKQEEQARQMKDPQGHAERLQWEDDQLQAQIEKSRDLRKDVRDSDRNALPPAHNKGKKPIVLDDVDIPAYDELSSGSFPSLSLSPVKDTQGSTKAKSRKRPSHHHAFSDAISGASRRARREAGRRQNQPVQAPRNYSILPEDTMPPVLPAGTMPPMLLAHLAFSTWPPFYMLLAALIRRLDDMLSSPLGQHILDYEAPHRFVIPTFATFDASVDPYDHMLHYNQAMILNASNDRLLYKVFLASLWGPELA